MASQAASSRSVGTRKLSWNSSNRPWSLMAPPGSSHTGTMGPRSRNVLIAKAPPVLAEFSSFLRDACRAEAVLAGHVERALPDHEVLDDAAVALGQTSKPGREV